MRNLAILSLVLFALGANAENLSIQSPITMEQLMSELQIRGGNWVFQFEEPVYAIVTCTVPNDPDANEVTTRVFATDTPETEIELYFMVGLRRIGDYPQEGGSNSKTMRIELSHCAQTPGPVLVPFMNKFAIQPWASMDKHAQRGEYRPNVARNPILNKEYILYYYFKEGDPYEVKATVSFIHSLDDVEDIERFSLSNPRWHQLRNERQRRERQ
jgi:hypothetical protein